MKTRALRQPAPLSGQPLCGAAFPADTAFAHWEFYTKYADHPESAACPVKLARLMSHSNKSRTGAQADAGRGLAGGEDADPAGRLNYRFSKWDLQMVTAKKKCVRNGKKCVTLILIVLRRQEMYII